MRPISRISPLRPSDPLKMSQISYTSGGTYFGIHLGSSHIEIDHPGPKSPILISILKDFWPIGPKWPFLGQNGTFWPTLADPDEIQGISKSGRCQNIKWPSWTPETDNRCFWMIWGVRGGRIGSGSQKTRF